MNVCAHDLREGLFAAMPILLDDGGRLDRPGLNRLIDRLAGTAIGGVAVEMLPGQAGGLDALERSTVMADLRQAFPRDRGFLLLASAGARPAIRRPDEVLEAARTDAQDWMDRGADVLIARPPTSMRGRPDRDSLVLEYHAALASTGVPILVSYRRELSGGVAYGPEVLAQLLARAEILGVEIATIDGIATFQQVAALIREQAPSKIVISGEERFLGYSLMCGADAAIVGIAAADPVATSALLKAHFTGDAAEFLKRSAEVDALARPIFRAPAEGSTRRLLETIDRLGAQPEDRG